MTTLSLHQSPRARHRIAIAVGRALLRSIPFSVIATLEGLVQLKGPPLVHYLVFINVVVVAMVGGISLIAWLYQRRVYGALDAQGTALLRSIPDDDPEEIRRLLDESWRRLKEEDARDRP